MLDIFSGLRLVVKRRTINIDNAIFRCHWFFTSTLLVSFSLIITARQYVGQPIECHSVDKIPDSLLNSYCWVQSTFTVPQACNNQHYGVEVPYPCIDNTRGREVKVFAYYQWVGIVLFIQGLMFHLPYYLWKLWENGLIKAITGGLRVAVLNEHERAKKKEIVVEYIHDHLGCHKRYALKYFLCEFICLINLLGQLWATNRFFDGQFLRYGLEVLEYSSSSFSSNSQQTTQRAATSSTSPNQQSIKQQLASISKEAAAAAATANSSVAQLQHSATTLPLARQHAANSAASYKQQVDPMTYIFPRMTKCSYFDFGSSGDVQKHDALCLLPLNIINEKIYIALWFWFIILANLTLIVIIYRLFAIVSEKVRCKGLISRCKLSSERDIELICHHCDVGDVFLLYQLAPNLDPIILREVIASIAAKINEHLAIKEQLRQQQAEEDFEREKLRLLKAEELRQQAARFSINMLDQPDSQAPPAGCVSSTRRNSIVDQVPFVRKIKKRLYNKRLWSIDLGSAEVRQQLFGRAGDQPPAPAPAPAPAPTTPPAASGEVQGGILVGVSSASATMSGTIPSAPPANQMPLNSMPPSAGLRRVGGGGLLQRRGSLTREASSSSTSGVSSVSSMADSFVMEMTPIHRQGTSSPCLVELPAEAAVDAVEMEAARWRALPNSGHRTHSGGRHTATDGATTPRRRI